MTLIMMSSNLSAKFCRILFCGLLASVLASCDFSQLNNPYQEVESGQNILYSSFSERPKHLDPAVAYSSNEYAFIAQIYEPPYQYHYLKRPYQLMPLTAATMPQVSYFDKKGNKLSANVAADKVAISEYLITIKPGIKFQPHPVFSRGQNGQFLYHQLNVNQLSDITTLSDFAEQQSRELTAEDYVYQIKRLAHPKIQSPIAEIMKHYIAGLDEFSLRIVNVPLVQLREQTFDGAIAIDRYRYKITIKGKYPQFRFWLAMPFFAPLPWEADVFYQQPGLRENNITLDWFPVGTGPYLLEENNPNRRMVLAKNPLFRDELYPKEGEPEDQKSGLLNDAGKKLPFIDRVVYMLEKETIPYWNKFLQGYFDASGIASDSFDQAVQFTGEGDAQLTPLMQKKGINLQTAVTTSIFYMGFNMLDPIIGGTSERARKLRQAISIAVDYEEYIAIFMNGRGLSAQGLLPPGIYGHQEGQEGVNPYVYEWKNDRVQRKAIEEARQLMVKAGYSQGIDPKTGEALTLYFDNTSVSVDDRPRMNWFRKQFAKLGIKLIIRATDYNRFQEKMRSGSGQLFLWGWNADYPDPENFFFLLYGPNGKVKYGGENAVNYANPKFDRLFEKMRNMDDSEKRFQIIQQMQEILRHDAPWIFGLHPKDFALYHSWYKNLKPNMMANNGLKYTRIDAAEREQKRQQWNKAEFWPLLLLLLILMVLLVPAVRSYRHRQRERVQ
jgi:peptide/nickel transport system substrate-binding protein